MEFSLKTDQALSKNVLNRSSFSFQDLFYQKLLLNPSEILSSTLKMTLNKTISHTHPQHSFQTHPKMSSIPIQMNRRGKNNRNVYAIPLQEVKSTTSTSLHIQLFFECLIFIHRDYFLLLISLNFEFLNLPAVRILVFT